MPKTVDDLYEEAYPSGPRLDTYVAAPKPPAPVPNSGIGGPTGGLTRAPEYAEYVIPRATLERAGITFPPAADAVAHPSHYTSHPSGIETIQITKHESFLRGNILKYVLRAPYKNREVEDLRKARQYLDWEIARAEGKEESNGATHR